MAAVRHAEQRLSDQERLQALLFAAEVPLRTAESCHALLNLALRALGRAGIKALPELGTGTALAFAGVVGGVVTARSFLAGMHADVCGAEATRNPKWSRGSARQPPEEFGEHGRPAGILIEKNTHDAPAFQRADDSREPTLSNVNGDPSVFTQSLQSLSNARVEHVARQHVNFVAARNERRGRAPIQAALKGSPWASSRAFSSSGRCSPASWRS